MVATACETLFVNRGIPVHQVSQRVKRRLGDKTLEIDVLVTNTNCVLIVEIKSSLGVDHVKELIIFNLNLKLGNYKETIEFFPYNS